MAGGEAPGDELQGGCDQGCGVGGSHCAQARDVGGGRRWGRVGGEVGHAVGGVGGAAAGRSTGDRRLGQNGGGRHSRGRRLGAPLQEEDHRWSAMGTERRSGAAAGVLRQEEEGAGGGWGGPTAGEPAVARESSR
jgi:hypothetical protein